MQIGIRFVTPKASILTNPDWLPEMAKTVEHAGRKSHRSEGSIGPGSAAPFIEKVAKKKGHESILEHAFITVDARMSRVASHQWVRHRLSSHTQESQRYCSYAHKKWGHILDVICPPSISGLDCQILEGTIVYAEGALSPNADWVYHVEALAPDEVQPMRTAFGERLPWRNWCRATLRSYGAYLHLLRESDIAPEDARFLLPNACRTEIVTTANVRQWRSFMRLRCEPHSQWEIRKIARELQADFSALAPWGFSDLPTYG